MYIEGLHNEGILVNEGESVPPPPKPEIGKPVELGPRQVDMSKVERRTVSLSSVNWGPPE